MKKQLVWSPASPLRVREGGRGCQALPTHSEKQGHVGLPSPICHKSCYRATRRKEKLYTWSKPTQFRGHLVMLQHQTVRARPGTTDAGSQRSQFTVCQPRQPSAHCSRSATICSYRAQDHGSCQKAHPVELRPFAMKCLFPADGRRFHYSRWQISLR